MTRFEYVIPSQLVIQRTFAHDEMKHDVYAVLLDGEQITTVDFKHARALFVGRIKLADILADDKKTDA